MEKKVYIIGAGAIGKALAVFLNTRGINAILIRASTSEIAADTMPLTISLHDGSTEKFSVPVSTLDKQQQFDGLIVLTNKSHANSSIAEQLQNKVGDSPVVLLQNGLNIEQPFVNKGFKNVCRCVLFATSQNTTDTIVKYKPVAISQVGMINGDSALLPSIIGLLDTPLFRFQANENIQPIIWQKVIANCVFNSICALLDVDNGIFYRDETARSLAIQVVDEGVTIAGEVGVMLNRDEVLKTILMISKSSDGQLISTLQDIQNKRLTEIDSLNFAIVRAAIHANKPDSVPVIKLLGELTRMKSVLSMKR